MLEQVRCYIYQNELLCPEDKVIVGVSAGADSVALIHLLVQLGYTCVLAHCNFRLRGEEADGDALFAHQIACRLQTPFYQVDFDTHAYAAKNRLSVEMAARELRYQWFEKLRIEQQAQAIAVGHHQDDSVETVLLNLIRGTGVRGLTGIHPRNGRVIRPLLSVNRTTILEWLAAQNLSYRTDQSNLSDAFTRNCIRHQVIPLLEQLNPSVKKTILRTAAHLSDTDKLCHAMIAFERERIVDQKDRIEIVRLLASPAPKTVLYELLRPYGFHRQQIGAIFDSLKGESGKQFYAPSNLYQVLKDRDYLLISEVCPNKKTVFWVKEGERNELPIGLEFEKIPITANFRPEANRKVALLDYNKITFPLQLRTWCKGDWFVPLGMKGRKKISDYYADRKFSRIQKEQTWLLCNAKDVIWVVGERLDDRYKVQEGTQWALRISFFL